MRFSHPTHGHDERRRHWRGEDGHHRRDFGRRSGHPGSDEPGALELARPFGHRGRHGFGRDGEHGEGRGRRRRVFDSGELQLVLLKLIADQPRHGYELIRAIEELTGGAYVPSPGVIYPTLTLLQDMGRIEEATAAGPRKAFAVTADGTAELVAKKPEVEALFARLAELAAQRERTDGGPVRRAMGNLRTVLLDRLSRDGVQSVPTGKASRYLQQLCKHWSHNLAVEFTEHNGKVVFPRNARGADWPGDATLTMQAHDDGLDCRLEASAAGQLDALKGAVARHIDRFAFREAPLAFNWQDTPNG
jgi:DNA-binding PadR family transcriptional regulator